MWIGNWYFDVSVGKKIEETFEVFFFGFIEIEVKKINFLTPGLIEVQMISNIFLFVSAKYNPKVGGNEFKDRESLVNNPNISSKYLKFIKFIDPIRFNAMLDNIGQSLTMPPKNSRAYSFSIVLRYSHLFTQWCIRIGVHIAYTLYKRTHRTNMYATDYKFPPCSLLTSYWW